MSAPAPADAALTDAAPDNPGSGTAVLSERHWRRRAEAHDRRVDDLVGDYLDRRRRGIPHPVIDFLFTYYPTRPAQLRRWHPGYGITLAGADEVYRRLTDYRVTDLGVTVDDSVLHRRLAQVRAFERLFTATAARPARLGCFGLHEWAMVYRDPVTRHDLPLRLGAAETDAVVDSLPLRCTHFDAYRFFTPAARPRNALELSRERQIDHEQPGCLHAGMDLYRACLKLLPLLPGELTLACFELALRARELDMAAGPYDLRDFGYRPVTVETSAGRAEYVRRQSELAESAAELRKELMTRLRRLLAPSGNTGE